MTDMRMHRVFFLGGESKDITSEDMRPIWDNKAVEFFNTIIRDGEPVEITQEIVPLSVVTGIQPRDAEVMPAMPAAPALPQMVEPNRTFDPNAVAAGVEALTQQPFQPAPPAGGGGWGQ